MAAFQSDLTGSHTLRHDSGNSVLQEGRILTSAGELGAYTAWTTANEHD
jgi:hypothetical protein